MHYFHGFENFDRQYRGYHISERFVHGRITCNPYPWIFWIATEHDVWKNKVFHSNFLKTFSRFRASNNSTVESMNIGFHLQWVIPRRIMKYRQLKWVFVNDAQKTAFSANRRKAMSQSEPIRANQQSSITHQFENEPKQSMNFGKHNHQKQAFHIVIPWFFQFRAVTISKASDIGYTIGSVST